MAFPTSPSNGDLYENANGTVYEYVSADDKWKIIRNSGSIATGSSFPGSPIDGELFYHTTDEALYIYREGVTAWIQIGGGGYGKPSGVLDYNHYIHLQDQKSAGTAGGTGTATTWTARVLNTEVNDIGNHCSLSSNQFTLSEGTYYCIASAPHYDAGTFKLRIRNVTDGTTVLIGFSNLESTSDNSEKRGWVRGVFTIGASKALELQYYIQQSIGASAMGVGYAAQGELEIYADVELWKVDE